jgi:hypothetical protein
VATAKDRVLNFFDDEIEKFLVQDIERLTNEIRPDSDGLRGCTVPLAMMLFATIDFFGYLVRDDLRKGQGSKKKSRSKKPEKPKTMDENEGKTDNTKSSMYLLSQAGLFPDEYSAKSEAIVHLFRHGLMHQVFPKASGIAKWGLDEPLIDPSPTPVLNVDVLARDVVQALRKLRSRIATAQNDDLADRMNRRLDILANDDREELTRLRTDHKI